MYKCIKVGFGVDVSVNKSKFFHYDSDTHFVTNLGAGSVRITRKIDGIHEIYETLISQFTSEDGTPVATTYEDLVEYFASGSQSLTAGEGISIADGRKVSVVAGSPSVLGAYKVGTGLTVDGTGRLSASASSEVTKVISTEAEMLALATEALRPYRVIRLDSKKLYYLNAGDSPAVLSNWFVGPSLETTVLSFNGRTGAVDPEVGDYSHDMVYATDNSTGLKYKFTVDGSKVYLESVSDGTKRELASASDIRTLESNFTILNDTVNNAATGIIKRLTIVEQKSASLDDTVNNATTGLVKKVQDIANRPAGKDYDSAIAALKAKDTEIENLTLFVNQKVDSTAANTVVLDQRVTALEDKGSGGSTQVVKTFNGRYGNVGPQTGDYISDQIEETLTKQFVTPEQKSEWSSKETTIGAQSKATAAQTAAKTYADSTFIPAIQKNVAGGVAGLDVNACVASANLPKYLPQSARAWRDVLSQTTRPYGTWITNTSPNEMVVYFRSTPNDNISRQLHGYIRADSSSTQFVFRSDAQDAAGNKQLTLTLTVPSGWQYSILLVGGTPLDKTGITSWFELS